MNIRYFLPDMPRIPSTLSGSAVSRLIVRLKASETCPISQLRPGL